MSETYLVGFDGCLVSIEAINETLKQLTGIKELVNKFAEILAKTAEQVEQFTKVITQLIRELIEAINRYKRQMYSIMFEMHSSSQLIYHDCSPRSPPIEESFKDKVETYYIWFCMFIFYPFLNYLFEMGIDNLVWFLFTYLFKLFFGMR